MTTPTRTRIIPREGLKLRDPKTGKQIPTEGIVVAGKLSMFWVKLLRADRITTQPEPEST